MRKYMTLVLALILCASVLAGCGCMGKDAEMTTMPTTLPAPRPTAPSTEAPAVPSTAPATLPQTEPTAMDGSTNETAGSDGIVDTEPSAPGTGETDTAPRHRNKFGAME